MIIQSSHCTNDIDKKGARKYQTNQTNKCLIKYSEHVSMKTLGNFLYSSITTLLSWVSSFKFLNCKYASVLTERLCLDVHNMYGMALNGNKRIGIISDDDIYNYGRSRCCNSNDLSEKEMECV